MRTMWVLAILLGFMAGTVRASEVSTQERGRELFESEKLGTTGKSCATCHPGGKKLEWAATYEEEKLAGIVNKCIKGPLKGKQLDPASPEMKSLIAYIKSLAGMN